jgi:predicted Zn-dependent protease
VFYHPDLKFEVTFPAGWPTQNKPEGVMAVSTQQDAGVQLRLAGRAPRPPTAANTFFTQQGITAGNTSNAQINGLPASSGDFRAQVDDGTVIQGSAAFIEYGQYTYMIMGYTLPDPDPEPAGDPAGGSHLQSRLPIPRTSMCRPHGSTP